MARGAPPLATTLKERTVSMLEDIQEMKAQGATQEEIDDYIGFCEEWAEINTENWQF